MIIWRKKRTGDFAALLLHVRELNESRATHNYRLTKVEKALSPQYKSSDTDKLNKRRFLPPAIAEAFSLAELRLFVFQLGGDFENLEGETKEDKALSLVLWMQRNGRFGELLEALGVERPWVVWERFG